MNHDEFSQGRCDDRHEFVDRELEAMRSRINGIERKLWAIIILVVVVLVGVITNLVNGG